MGFQRIDFVRKLEENQTKIKITVKSQQNTGFPYKNHRISVNSGGIIHGVPNPMQVPTKIRPRHL